LKDNGNRKEPVMKKYMRLLLPFIVMAVFVSLQPGPAGAAATTGAPDPSNKRELRAKVGEPAPNFTLDALVGKEFKKISLIDYRGKWVVLFFYPLDFTFVCPTEIRAFNGALKDFERLNAVVLGASVDSIWSHKAWQERGDLGDLKYPLLSDIRKDTARKYGILDEREGVAQRGLFIIDDKGVLQYLSVNNLSVGRSIEETLRVLEAFQTGELCPVNWKPGQKTLGK
jgi:alkyl hydroperoxide reductase subunit AhpC